METQRKVRSVYLDNNASSPPLPEVLEAIVRAMSSEFGNPSSAHSIGDRARALVDEARCEVADLINAGSHQITFTSGGTEANNLAISSVALGSARCRIVTSPIEHSSVLKHCQYLESHGHEIVWLSIDSNGQIDPMEIENQLERPTDLVTLQWVNNETGVIQPIQDVAQICKRRKVLLHCDAAQAVGKIVLDFSKVPIDLVSFTAHKIHGPQGIGALCQRSPRVAVRPMLYGGDQEEGRRPGTENVAGIAGFGRAAQIRRVRLENWLTGVEALREKFVHVLRESLDDVVINGCGAPRVCNTANVRFSGIDGHALIAHLDQRGIACSQSSACTNRRPEPSYVLRAMGLSEDEAYASVRFSFSELNSEADIDYAIENIVEAVTELRQFSGSSVFAA